MQHTDLVSSAGAERLGVSIAVVVKLLTIGIPAALQSSIVSFSMIVVASIVNTFGPTVVAASGAAGRLDQFAFLPALSVSLAVSALVGQNLGAGKFERVKEIVQWSVLLVLVITGLITLVALLKPAILIQIFTNEPEVLAEGSIPTYASWGSITSRSPWFYYHRRVAWQGVQYLWRRCSSRFSRSGWSAYLSRGPSPTNWAGASAAHGGRS